ncbi:MAG: hypothetical protein Q8R91_07990 [Candidatus Omnitrophota bacterium]|nr:hypothetical protein [Candidatus Omnitrophota bacterium]
MEGSMEWLEGAGLLVMGVVVWGMTVGAQWLSPELREVRRLPVQHEGEVTSMASFARNTLEEVTGRSSFGGQDPVVTLLGMLADPEQWRAQPLIWVPSRSVRKTLGLSADTTHTALNDATLSERLALLLPPIIEKRRRGGVLTRFEREVLAVYGRLLTLKEVLQGGAPRGASAV